MGAPAWMKDVADSFSSDLSGRKKAAAEVRKRAAAEADAAVAAEAAAERKKAVRDASRVTDSNPAGIQFKRGGKIDGAALRGKTRGRRTY